MANEITATLGFKCTKTSAPVDLITRLTQITMAGIRKLDIVQVIGTSEEALQIGELASLGWCFIENLDATNFVELRTGTGGTKFCKLKAGEWACFRFGSGVSAPYAIADTAACNLRIVILET